MARFLFSMLRFACYFGQHSCFRSPHETYPAGHAHAAAVANTITIATTAIAVSRNFSKADIIIARLTG